MNTPFFVLILALFFGQGVHSQSILQLNIEQAQALGVTNRLDMVIETYGVDIASDELDQVKQELYPQIDFSGRINYHPQIQSTLIPSGFGGLDEPTVLALGAKSISVFSLGFHQTIYDPVLFSDIKIKRVSKEIAEEKIRALTVRIKEQISVSYLDVLLRRLQWRIALEEQQRFQAYLKLAKGKFDNGTLIKNQMLRAELDFENAKQRANVSEQSFNQSMLDLKYQMNIPSETKLALSDSLLLDMNPLLMISQEPLDSIKRSEYRMLLLEERQNELEQRRQRGHVLPKLTLSANYAQQFLNENFYYKYSDSEWWSPFNSIGLQVSVPLTGQLTNRKSKHQLQTKRKQLVTEKEKFQKKMIHEVHTAEMDLLNEYENLSEAQRNLDLAKQIYANQKLQLELGAFGYEGILNTEASMSESESHYIRASYNYMLALLHYKMAKGNL